MKRKKCSTSVEYSVVQLSKTVDVSSVLTQAVGLNAVYFERKKPNTHDNSRTVLLSANKLTYTKTLKTYKTRSTVGVVS